MPTLRLRKTLGLALLAALPAAGQPAGGLGELHGFKAWHVGCDNTRRCEAQGYHTAGEGTPAALQVLRDGGPGAPVRLRAGFGDDGSVGTPPAAGESLELTVGTRRFALPPLDAEGFTEATPAQVRELLPLLLKAEQVQLATPRHRGTVLLAGATAALLKMDDLQGRVGTVGALVRPGPKPDTATPPAPPAVSAVRVPPERPADAAAMAGLRAALKIDADTCHLMTEHPERPPVQVLRLSDTRVMVVYDCWLAAYQGGGAAWTANARPPYAPQRVRFAPLGAPSEGDDTPTMLDITRDTAGRLVAHSGAKGRGVGDCWSTRTWAWDGQRFALTEAFESPCAAFSAGGLLVRLWQAALR
jgi:Protein of unknown function (DUF1176)